MNYLNIYNSLIGKIKSENRGQDIEKFFEVHHIIPKCMDGSDDMENLIKLTYREHFIAHRLLAKIYPTNHKIQYAFFCLIRNPHGNRIITSRMFNVLKVNHSKFMSWYMKINNPGQNTKTKEINKARLSSDKNPMRLHPEKNNANRKTIVEYSTGEIKEFPTRSSFVNTLSDIGLTASQIRYKINNNALLEYGITNVQVEKRPTTSNLSCTGRKWYNNGIKNLYIIPGTEPLGFSLGMIKQRKE